MIHFRYEPHIHEWVQVQPFAFFSSRTGVWICGIAKNWLEQR